MNQHIKIFTGYGMDRIKNDGPQLNYQVSEVVWGDGTRDMREAGGGSDRSTCITCHNFNCNVPVHMEKYRVLNSPIAREWDSSNPVI